jgi:hypothetical protein
MIPDHINPLQWSEATGVARAACARIFRDGGSPGDALAQFGLPAPAEGRADWAKAVDRIAESLCSDRRLRRAA